jgi:hypothetical protein
MRNQSSCGTFAALEEVRSALERGDQTALSKSNRDPTANVNVIYVVTSPLDPELITEEETIEEAFVNAYDAAPALRKSRAKLLRQLAGPHKKQLVVQ